MSTGGDGREREMYCQCGNLVICKVPNVCCLPPEMSFFEPVALPSCLTPIVQHFPGGLEAIVYGTVGSSCVGEVK